MCKRLKWLCACVVCLVLAVVAVPAFAVQAADGCEYQWMYHQNPLYPDAPVYNQRLFANTQAVKKEDVCHDTLQQAAVELREGMKDREEVITVTFMSSSKEKKIINELFDVAVAHTGEPTEGDYLLWHYSGWGAEKRTWDLGGTYRNEITYYMNYLSTAAQEKLMDKAAEMLLDRLDVYEASDYEKVVAIYDYICENIEYDYVGAQTGSARAHTAYAALVDGEAVCQGYASLFYRLALSLDVDTRVISGIGNGGAHGWNIVKLGGRYYDLDATWDATLKQNHRPYEYFLRCDENFVDHIRDEKYLTEEFQTAYRMAQKDYGQEETVPEETVPGNLDGESGVTEDDAIYLLQHVLMAEYFPVNQNVDYDDDGQVTEDDAIYLLQYVLMPEYFPLIK